MPLCNSADLESDAIVAPSRSWNGSATLARLASDYGRFNNIALAAIWRICVLPEPLDLVARLAYKSSETTPLMQARSRRTRHRRGGVPLNVDTARTSGRHNGLLEKAAQLPIASVLLKGANSRANRRTAVRKPHAALILNVPVERFGPRFRLWLWPAGACLNFGRRFIFTALVALRVFT